MNGIIDRSVTYTINIDIVVSKKKCKNDYQFRTNGRFLCENCCKNIAYHHVISVLKNNDNNFPIWLILPINSYQIFTIRFMEKSLISFFPLLFDYDIVPKEMVFARRRLNSCWKMAIVRKKYHNSRSN